MSHETQPENGGSDEKKGGGWGCLKIILILFGFGVLGMIGLTYYISTTPEAQKVFAAAKDGYALFSDAKEAPGMDALRAAGCQEALAFDMARLRKIVERFDSSAKTEFNTNVNVELLVHCQVAQSATTPSCDEVAKTYVKAVSPARDFGVVIQDREPTMGSGERTNTRCDGLYGSKGERKADLEAALPEQSDTQP